MEATVPGSGLPEQPAVEHEREVAIADDGRPRKVTFVGPIKIVFGNRLCHTGALVLVEKVLLGVLLKPLRISDDLFRQIIEPYEHVSRFISTLCSEGASQCVDSGRPIPEGTMNRLITSQVSHNPIDLRLPSPNLCERGT
ncbi:hypothetical protein [Lamprobacter modestohalophilus]|uniref:hypothetical protein n=1 Tax=Lamprobacter modestohalophilus TaxID=1064514 RepID=UPI00190440C7|nr:hypothetical protein [Lamprobacter modestohalophilus]